MAKIYLAIDTKQKGVEQILLQHALNGKEGWVFVHVHPRLMRLLEAMEEASFGDVSFDLRHGLPENIRVARLLPTER